MRQFCKKNQRFHLQKALRVKFVYKRTSLCLVSFSIKCRQCQSQVSMDECLLNDKSVKCYSDESCFSTSYAIHGNLKFYQKGCIHKNRCTDISICGSPARCKVRLTSSITQQMHHVVPTSIRHLYDVADVVQTSYKR